jgi:hypothetical protein
LFNVFKKKGVIGMKKYTVFTKTNSKCVMVGVATVLVAALMTGCSSNTADVTEEVVEVATTADAVTEAVIEAEDTTTEIVADEDTLTTEESTEAIDEVTTEADTTEAEETTEADTKTTEATKKTTEKTTEASKKTTEASTNATTKATTSATQSTGSTGNSSTGSTQKASTGNSASTGSSSSSSNATTQKATTEATTQHVHNYNQIVYGTRTVHHDAVTHTEQQTVMKKQEFKGVECKDCGAIFDTYNYPVYGEAQAALNAHQEQTGHSWSGTSQFQVHEVATTETVTVVDQAAYDETEEYIVGYKCSCGAMME